MFDRDLKQIVGASVLTFISLFVFDIYKVIEVKPFTDFGSFHWFPEILALFLFANYIGKHTDLGVRWIIFTCSIIYPLLSYTLSTQFSFGAITAAIFASAMLLGFMKADIGGEEKHV